MSCCRAALLDGMPSTLATPPPRPASIGFHSDHAPRNRSPPPLRSSDSRFGGDPGMSEIDIGRAKRARRAYSFDDIAIVPSRRTRDPEEVNVSWQIDAYRFELPILAAPMDSVMSPQTAIAFGKYGGLGVLNLEGLWTRYEEPRPLIEEVTELQGIQATRRLQEIYAEPIKPELINARLSEIREAGVPVAGSLSPQRTKLYAKCVVD